MAELTQGLRNIALFLFFISGIINVLALTGSIYMMQIYDRALTSASIPTLLVLSGLAIGLYLFQGAFDVIRSQVLVRVGARLDKKVAPLAHRVAIDMPRFGFSDVRSAGARARCRYRARLPRQPGPVGPVRSAMDADLPGLRLFPPSDAGRADHSPVRLFSPC